MGIGAQLLGPYSASSQAHEQLTTSIVKLPGLKPVPLQDAGITGRTLTTYATMLAPNKLEFSWERFNV